MQLKRGVCQYLDWGIVDAIYFVDEYGANFYLCSAIPGS